MKNSKTEIVVIGLLQFEAEALWWIGRHFNESEEEEAIPLEDCDTNEDFGDQFNVTECIETHQPSEVEAAMARAREIAKERGVPLYRVTKYKEHGGDCEVFEELFYPRKN